MRSNTKPRLIVFTAAALAVAAYAIGCGTITGLSDDFKFTDEAGSSGSSGASGGDGSSGGSDGSSSGADSPSDTGSDVRKDSSSSSGGSCSVTEQASATTTMTDQGGQNLPPGCEVCLAQQCCTSVNACGQNDTCKTEMACVFGCQSRATVAARQSCVTNSCLASYFSFSEVSMCNDDFCLSTCGKWKP